MLLRTKLSSNCNRFYLKLERYKSVLYLKVCLMVIERERSRRRKRVTYIYVNFHRHYNSPNKLKLCQPYKSIAFK